MGSLREFCRQLVDCLCHWSYRYLVSLFCLFAPLYLTRTFYDASPGYSKDLMQINSKEMDVPMTDPSASESPENIQINERNDSAAEPLHRLIRKIRPLPTLRELMASCLRSIHMGDPFSDAGGALWIRC
jgi:hypothetical protein